MPDSRNAAAAAADTDSSSVAKTRGPASNNWVRDPNALKIEAGLMAQFQRLFRLAGQVRESGHFSDTVERRDG